MSTGTKTEFATPRSRARQLKIDLLTVRKITGFDRLDAIVLATYTAVLAFAIHHYQPFADEAQAWLIARDSSLHELLFRRLHYEGAPALWPLILWVANRLHLPYSGINWLSGIFAIAGTYILLRYSPFPRIFRWLLPFTFFLQYEYAVIARPYALFPALLFTLCILYTLDRRRPVLFALIAGLIANISLHAAIVSLAFSLLYLYDLFRQQHSRNQFAVRLAPAAGIFILLFSFAAAVAFPAPDAITALTPDRTVLKPNALLRRLVPEERLPPSAPPLDPPLSARGDAAKARAQADASANSYPEIVRTTVLTIILAANAACYPIAESNLLAVLFLVCIWYWLWTRGYPRLLLPYLFSVLLSVRIFVLPHHTGIFLLALVAAAWIVLNAPVQPQARPALSPWIQPTICVVALMVVLLQIGWSFHCIRSEAHASTDPGHATEVFLSDNFAGKRIAGFGFESVSTQAYAQQNLFFNQPQAFWLWSANVVADRRRTAALAQHPDIVVTSDLYTHQESVFNQWHAYIPDSQDLGLPMRQFLEQNGYRETHRFCGDRFIRSGEEFASCEVIMEPVVTTPTIDPN